MKATETRSQSDYTFDTCIGIKMGENPNFGSLLKCRLDFEGATVHLCTQTILEASNLRYDSGEFFEIIEETLGATAIEGPITEEIRQRAGYLVNRYSTLHHGDNLILAYAEAAGTTLVTCDKKLARTAELIGVEVINPYLLASDHSGRRFRPRVQKSLKKAIKNQTSKHVGKLVPGKKIIWRSFE